MKLAVAILISGSGSNMVKLVKSMDDEHPAFPSVVISSRSDALGLKKAQDLGVPTEVIDAHYFKKNNLDFEKELLTNDTFKIREYGDTLHTFYENELETIQYNPYIFN